MTFLTGFGDSVPRYGDAVLIQEKDFRMKQVNPRTGDESSQFRSADDPSPVRLTAREHEVLEWAAKGKSVWEIARILGRSEAAINFHMCNIRRKFGVSSLRAALVMAIGQGLILLH